MARNNNGNSITKFEVYEDARVARWKTFYDQDNLFENYRHDPVMLNALSRKCMESFDTLEAAKAAAEEKGIQSKMEIESDLMHYNIRYIAKSKYKEATGDRSYFEMIEMLPFEHDKLKVLHEEQIAE
ncbi:MAG: hypothetical protein MJ105_01990 [Lachnospiraceae bacterium]|nr:hypothetical protein [Lachnospiraceae bacterium]